MGSGSLPPQILAILHKFTDEGKRHTEKKEHLRKSDVARRGMRYVEPSASETLDQGMERPSPSDQQQTERIFPKRL